MARRDARLAERYRHTCSGMARRYDSIEGATMRRMGSTLRGVLKGWFKHGAASLEQGLFQT